MTFNLEHRLRVFALIVIATISGSSRGDAATMKEVGVSWQSPVCHLESYGKTPGTGTGFLVLTRDPGTVLLFTAKHMVHQNDSLRITIGAYDSSGSRIALSNTWPLLEGGHRIYHISDTLQDCAWIAVNTSGLLKSSPPGFTIAAVKEESFVHAKDLFPGLPIVFTGYPAGLSVGQKAPLSRRGSVAGFDPATNTLLIDAMAVGGFSGSPVFLDNTQSIAKDFTGGFIGLVFARTDVTRNFATQDSSTTLSVPENIGITRVVPADVLLPSVRLFDPKK